MQPAEYDFTIYQGTVFSRVLQWSNPVKQAVTAVATANITLSGTPTVDGVTLQVGQRVLVVGQTTTSQNGIYLVSGGNWLRANDMLNGIDFTNAYILVGGGATYANTYWNCITTGAIIPGTTSLIFVQVGSSAINMTGWSGSMQIRDEQGNLLTAVTVTITGPTAGEFTISLTSAQTTALTFDVADYDLKLTDASGNPSRLIQGRVHLSKQITT